MSDKQPPTRSTAVRKGETSDEQQALRSFLQSENITNVTEFAPKDDDEMNTEALAGKFDHLIFANLDALLAAVWKGEAELDRWEAMGIRVDLAVPPSGEESWRALLSSIYASLARFRRQQRRRQIGMAVILSVLGLIAVSILLFLIPPAT